MIAEIRSDGAEPGRNSRRHDAAPDSRPGSFFILAFPSRRQAEPAPISRRHDAAPDSRPGSFFILAFPSRRQAEPAPISRRHDAAPDSRPGSFFILAFPSRRQAEPAPISRRHDAAPDSRIGFVRAPTACLAVPGVCLLRGGRSAPPTPGAFAGLAAPAGSPSTHQWACPAHTRGSFRFTTKGTKGVPGLRPWTP